MDRKKEVMDNTPTNKKTVFTEWLEKLQQESWQLELLISGFAIYGLFYAKAAMADLMFNVNLTGYSHINVKLIIPFIEGICIALNIFIINLIFHVFVRGLWIGAIGLRYVSGDIDYEQLKFSSVFTAYFKKKIGSFDDYIERLEKFASIIFSFTFLIFLILLSLSIFFSFCKTLLLLSSELTQPFGIFYQEGYEKFNYISDLLIFIVFIITILTSFDFFTFGLLKKAEGKYFPPIYLWFYRIGSLLTLSFLWKPLLLNFIDQKYTRRLFLLAIPYALLIGVIIPNFSISSTKHSPLLIDKREAKHNNILSAHSFHFRFYDDDRQVYFQNTGKRFYNELSIPSKRVSGKTGELFFTQSWYDQFIIAAQDSSIFPISKSGLNHSYFSSRSFTSDQEEERELKHQKYKTQLRKEYRKTGKLYTNEWYDLIDSLKQEYEREEEQIFEENLLKTKEIIKRSIRLRIDNKLIDPDRITCDYYRHPHAGELGMLLFYPLDSLSDGRHLLQVNKLRIGRTLKKPDTLYSFIPFIYEGSD